MSEAKIDIETSASGVSQVPTLSGLSVKLNGFLSGSGAVTGHFEGVFSRGSASQNGRYRLYVNNGTHPDIIRPVDRNTFLPEGRFAVGPAQDTSKLGGLLRAPHTFVLFAKEMAGSGDPDSAWVTYTVNEKLNSPLISSASANKSTVTVTGVAPYANVMVKVTVDSKSETVQAASGRSWTATFNNVPSGTHSVLAQVVDNDQVFRASDIVTGQVVVP